MRLLFAVAGPFTHLSFHTACNVFDFAFRTIFIHDHCSSLIDCSLDRLLVYLNNSRLSKKVLLVITDGQDNLSQETLQEASRRLQPANGPTLYAIGLTGSGLQSEEREALQRLATGTGGVAYFPDSLDQVDSITRTVARDIRSQYIIAYKPRNQNGKPDYQSPHVEAHAPGYAKLTVRTRSGYYPPESGNQEAAGLRRRWFRERCESEPASGSG